MNRPPLRSRRLRAPLAAGLAALVLAGCAGAPPVQPAAQSSASEVRSALRRLPDASGADSLSASERAARLRYAAGRLAQYGLTPAAGGRYLRAYGPPGDSARAHVLAYLPGRRAGARNDLVVVAADLGGPAAAAVLATAQRLARLAVYENVPERTLLVALWGPPHAGARGFADYAALPAWQTDHIEGVYYVTADTTQMPAVRRVVAALDTAITVEAVVPPAEGREGTSTLAAMERAREVGAVLLWADRVAEALLRPPDAGDRSDAFPTVPD